MLRKSVSVISSLGLAAVMVSGYGATPSFAASRSHVIPLKNITIGYSVSTLQNQFFVGLTQGVEREAKALGVHLIFDSANGSPGTQLNQVEEMVSQHVNAIILNPIDANGITPAVEQANRAHIPVITLDRTAFGGKIASFVRVSSIQMAREAGQWLANQLKARYGSYRGNVVDLEGLMSTSPGQARQKGFMEIMKKYPNIHVIATLPGNFDQSQAYNMMTDAIRANSGKQIDGVFNANDDNSIGAERAIAAAGLSNPPSSRKHIFVTGMDGTSQGLAAIKSGSQDMTVAQNPMKEAEAAVQMAVEKIEGMSIPANVRWPHMLITAHNINSAAVKSYGLWSLDLNNPKIGNIPNMNSLPIYTASGHVAGSYKKLYAAIRK